MEDPALVSTVADRRPTIEGCVPSAETMGFQWPEAHLLAHPSLATTSNTAVGAAEASSETEDSEEQVVVVAAGASGEWSETHRGTR